MKTNCVIYKVTNNLNGKVYIGKTVQKFESRCKAHRYKSCIALNNAFKSYGWENFTKEIIFNCFKEEDLASCEEFFINQFNSLVPNGYNIIKIDNGLNRYSDEIKKKISDSRLKYLSTLESPLVAVNKKEHIFINNLESKHCAKCNEIKNLEDFGKNNKRWDNLHMYCKPCWIDYNKKYKLNAKKMTKDELSISYKLRTIKMKKSIIEMYNRKQNNMFIFDHEKNDTVKSAIWESVINAKSKVFKHKIYARKCSINLITDISIIRSFLNSNHIQGYAHATINYGLYYNDKLIQVMTFSKPRYNNDCEWELIRLASSIDTIVIGGASKLLNFFEKQNNPASLLSYANLRFSKGDIYTTLGFSFVSKSRPNYFYTKDGIILSRIACQKHKLHSFLKTFDKKLTEKQNMLNNGYRIVCDKGNLLFIKKYSSSVSI